MDSQRFSPDLPDLAYTLSAPPPPAQEDKVVASLSLLPAELKLKIVKEIYEAPWTPAEGAAGFASAEWGLLRCRKTRIKGLSLVDKQFHELSATFMWRDVDLSNVSLLRLHFFVSNICRKHSTSIRTMRIDRISSQCLLLIASVSTSSPPDQTLPLFHRYRKMTWAERNTIFDQAEELEERMTGSTTRYKAENCQNCLEFRWDIEGVFLSYILRTCPGLRKLNVFGSGLPQQSFSPPSLHSLRGLTLELRAPPNLAILRQSPHLQELCLTWLGEDFVDESDEIVSCIRQLRHLTSLSLVFFPPSFFVGPPVINLQLEALSLLTVCRNDPVPLTFLQSFAPTLCHLHLKGFAEPVNPPPNEPLLPHLVSLKPPDLWHALGFSGPVGGD